MNFDPLLVSPCRQAADTAGSYLTNHICLIVLVGDTRQVLRHSHLCESHLKENTFSPSFVFCLKYLPGVQEASHQDGLFQ